MTTLIQKLPEYKIEYLIYFIFFENRIWHPTNMTCFTRSHQIQNFPTPFRLGSRLKNPRLVAEKGKIVKLHKLAILLSQSQQGYSCTSTSQHNLSVRSRGSAYSHIRRELFLSCRCHEWK